LRGFGVCAQARNLKTAQASIDECLLGPFLLEDYPLSDHQQPDGINRKIAAAAARNIDGSSVIKCACSSPLLEKDARRPKL
jgi:hypothetical protein